VAITNLLNGLKDIGIDPETQCQVRACQTKCYIWGVDLDQMELLVEKENSFDWVSIADIDAIGHEVVDLEAIARFSEICRKENIRGFNWLNGMILEVLPDFKQWSYHEEFYRSCT
jgi:hypothetical protein